jgi:hypothetical protein
MRSLLFPSPSPRLLSVPSSYLPGPSLSLHFLCRPYSSSTSRPFPDHLPLQQGQDELAFSDQEMLRTIETVRVREDDKGSKTLSCKSSLSFSSCPCGPNVKRLTLCVWHVLMCVKDSRIVHQVPAITDHLVELIEGRVMFHLSDPCQSVVSLLFADTRH